MGCSVVVVVVVVVVVLAVVSVLLCGVMLCAADRSKSGRSKKPGVDTFTGVSKSNELQKLVVACQDEKVKIAALNACMSISDRACNQTLLDFLIAQLEQARTERQADYESVVARHLGIGYEWTSEEETQKAVLLLLEGLKSPHENVRISTALAFTGIPNEQGLLAAFEVVQSSTWDGFFESYGKDLQVVRGGFLTFRSRPTAFHDNRHAVLNRILRHLVALHQKRGMFNNNTLKQHSIYNKLQLSVEKEFSDMALEGARYVPLELAYPPNTQLIRALSPRKGKERCIEALRDLIRKGAGSSEVTDYGSCVYTCTWNKIGHMFASHNKNLFFDSTPMNDFFSTNENGVVTDGALIIFPAAYFEKEYIAGEARFEYEGTLNNVFYRGIPHRWISAIYLPKRFAADIYLLASDLPIQNIVKLMKTELFKSDSLQELESFRRLLKASEADLTQTATKFVPLISKIRFFPELSLEDLHEYLIQENLSFAEERDIKETTALYMLKKQTVCTDYAKRSHILMDALTILRTNSDTLFSSRIDILLKILPSTLLQLDGFKGESTLQQTKNALMKLSTDKIPGWNVHLRVACLLYLSWSGAKEILQKKPIFFGLRKMEDISIVAALIQYHTCNVEQVLIEAHKSLSCTNISYQVFRQLLTALAHAHSESSVIAT